jgi:hypothetical protein
VLQNAQYVQSEPQSAFTNFGLTTRMSRRHTQTVVCKPTHAVRRKETFKSTLMKVVGVALLGIGVAGSCLAVPVPEIDTATGANTLALVAGALMILRSRRK